MADQFPDARTLLFRDGLARLSAQTGRSENHLRSLLGKWLKSTGDDAAAVYAQILVAYDKRLADPISWIEASLTAPKRKKLYSELVREQESGEQAHD